MTRLVRTRIGELHLRNCTALDQLCSADDVARKLQSPRHLVEGLTTVQLDEAAAAQIRNGIPIPLEMATEDQISRGEIIRS